MGLKVYAFFKVRHSEINGLHTQNHDSYFFQIKNQQSEPVRTAGVLNGLLSDEEMYHAPSSTKTTTTKLRKETKNEDQASDDNEVQVLNDEKDHPRSSLTSSTDKNPTDNSRKSTAKRNEKTTKSPTRRTTKDSNDNKNGKKRKIVRKCYEKEAHGKHRKEEKRHRK